MTRPQAQTGDVISAEGLCMRYRAKDVLRDLSFRVRRGEAVALLGPNGAGKTTTVEILEGFRRPSAGQVRVLGASPLTADCRWRARTGIVLQSWRDHGRWRVREFLDYQASYYRPYACGQEPGPWAAGDLLASGPFTDAPGALLVFRAASRDALDRLLAQDPYAAAGVLATVEAHAWDQVFGPWAD